MEDFQFKNILVPYTGTDEDDRLLAAVCRIAKANKAKVSIVYVVEVPMALPVEAENFPDAEAADDILDRAETVAAEAGSSVETQILHAREAGAAIVELAHDSEADLIFMEAHRPTRFRFSLLGRTVEYVLKRAPCAVWVSRSSPKTVKDVSAD